MFSKKILVIDDTELTQRMIRDILVKEGYEVYSAYSGEEGLDMVVTVKPDLIFLDIIMPGMSGFDVCRILRADDSNILTPIIMLTAQVSEDDKLIGLEMGADDYIIKPFNNRELLSRVRNTLIRIDRNRCANPLTGLSGNIEIQSELNHRLANRFPIEVIYCDLDNFKAFNDVYGFAKGDSAIRLTADIIRDAVHQAGTRDDFIGHIGGDDFLIITAPERGEDICRIIIEDFDRKIVFLYNETDIKNKYIVTKDRLGQIKKFPIMSISLAIITNESVQYENALQIAQAAAEVKKFVKSMPGSNYLKDRRINNG
ncbi:MAG: response regulator [Clostridiaceae bacterium]|jgi:diguanylate cyclase (GGDEF)-like protein|nr:response regulator [Clostridiaceae bacterium]